MPYIRQIKEGLQPQGEDEKIAWVFDVSGWTPCPSAPSALMKDVSTGASVANVLNGAATASGSTITSPTVQNLVAGSHYRLEIKFLDPGGNTLEGYMLIDGET